MQSIPDAVPDLLIVIVRNYNIMDNSIIPISDSKTKVVM